MRNIARDDMVACLIAILDDPHAHAGADAAPTDVVRPAVERAFDAR